MKNGMKISVIQNIVLTLQHLNFDNIMILLIYVVENQLITNND
jgi:hypothetical protein